MLRIAVCDNDMEFAGWLETLVLKEAAASGIRAEAEAYSDGEGLLADMRKGSRFELVYLEIGLKGLNGIETARRIREKDRSALLIFVSCHGKCLKELFEVEPFRFLPKPVDEECFRRYFREALQRIGELEGFFQFSFNRGFRKVPLRDILYFESRNRVIYIFLGDGTQERFYGKLNDVENKLAVSCQYFLRIHQSFLVNYNYIRKISFSSVLLSLGDGREISLKISEDRQKIVRRELSALAGRRPAAPRDALAWPSGVFCAGKPL